MLHVVEECAFNNFKFRLGRVVLRTCRKMATVAGVMTIQCICRIEKTEQFCVLDCHGL